MSRHDTSTYQTERGLFDLKRGRLLCVTNGGREAALVATVDGLDQLALAELQRLASPVRLVVTFHRARAMGLSVTDTAVTHLSVGLRDGVDPESIVRLASARGRFETRAFDVREASAPEVGGLMLARLGHLLPAVVSGPADLSAGSALTAEVDRAAVLCVRTAGIEAMAEDAAVELTLVSEGTVPLEEAEDARFLLYRDAHGLAEHLAVLIGDRARWPDPLPVRLHSACLTGDLFGSLRCDCGAQLRGSLRAFRSSGGGVLLYMAQEGRNIGLGNKLRAYGLQEEGLDTVDADGTLGFGADERRYDAAIQMLRELGIQRVELLTNNPEKVRALREGGILVMHRQPLYGTLNPHNVRYVTSKVQRAGHWLGEMLTGVVPGK